MRASLTVVFVCVTVGAALPSSAREGPRIEVNVDDAHVGVARPLPISARVTVRDPDVVVVNVCEDWQCVLYRSYAVPDVGAPLSIEQHPPLGPVFTGEHFIASQAVSTSPSSTRSMSSHDHAVALYGDLDVGALERAAHVRGAAEAVHASGLEPVEATRALDDHPEHALSFAAVVLAPSRLPGDALLASLQRLVELGGAVALPLSSSERLSVLLEGAALEPLLVDEDTRLVERGSQRVIASGARALRASAARKSGGVVIVYDDSERLGEGVLADALLTALPRLSHARRLQHGDTRRSPASAAAAIAVSRPSRPLVLLLPLVVAGVVLWLTLRARRRRSALLSRGALAFALVATGALLVVPRVLGDGGAVVEVRTYLSFGDAPGVLEEGARAVRPSPSGGEVTLRGPDGTVPGASLRGLERPLPTRVYVSEGGRTLRFFVHGDGIGVASWLRPVAFEGLRVTSTAGGWPRSPDDTVVTSGLPFALDDVLVMTKDRQPSRGGRLEPGASVRSWGPVDVLGGEVTDRRDPLALAKQRLLHDLRQRCVSFNNPPSKELACVVGVGTAQDGALVGVQVLSP